MHFFHGIRYQEVFVIANKEKDLFINEQIRAYAKIMTMVFKEDYNIAKLIVSKATGKEFKDKKEKKGK